MSPVSKEYVVNPLSALVPDEGHFSSLIDDLESLRERLNYLEENISIDSLEEDQKRAILAETEMLKQILSWATTHG